MALVNKAGLSRTYRNSSFIPFGGQYVKNNNKNVLYQVLTLDGVKN